MKDRFAARYRGNRFSFGYPACPDLDDQAALWRLLGPEEIGISPHGWDDDGARSQRSALWFFITLMHATSRSAECADANGI